MDQLESELLSGALLTGPTRVALNQQLARSVKPQEYCSKCGNLLMEDSEFCRKCGTRRLPHGTFDEWARVQSLSAAEGVFRQLALIDESTVSCGALL